MALTVSRFTPESFLRNIADQESALAARSLAQQAQQQQMEQNQINAALEQQLQPLRLQQQQLNLQNALEEQKLAPLRLQTQQANLNQILRQNDPAYIQEQNAQKIKQIEAEVTARENAQRKFAQPAKRNLKFQQIGNKGQWIDEQNAEIVKEFDIPKDDVIGGNPKDGFFSYNPSDPKNTLKVFGKPEDVPTSTIATPVKTPEGDILGYNYGKEFIKPEKKEAKGGAIKPDPRAAQLAPLVMQSDKILSDLSKTGYNPSQLINPRSMIEKVASDPLGSILHPTRLLTSIPSLVENVVPLPQIAKSNQRQSYDQAADQLALAALRFESGAAISPKEAGEYKRIYTDQPGDSDALRAQKSNARRLLAQGLEALARGELPPSLIEEYTKVQDDILSASPATPQSGGSPSVSPKSDPLGIFKK